MVKTMADEKKNLKSYMADMQMEIVTEDDSTVKDIRIHGFHNDAMPVRLWCDLIKRLENMTPGEKVMFIQSAKERMML